MPFKYVFRRLLRSPMFTGITLLTLAIGIGANSAIFSVIEGILLNPLPYPHPQELISLGHSAPGINLPEAGAAPYLYFTYRDENRTLTDIAIWSANTVTVTGFAEPAEVDSLHVTDGILNILGVQPALGRGFSRQDDLAGNPETVILTHAYWQSKFGGDRSVVGRRLLIDGKAHEVIGVLPQGFRFLNLKPALVLPLQRDRNKTFLGNFSYQAFARLKPGVTVAQATADITRLLPIANGKFPPPPGFNVKMFEEARLTPHLLPLKQELVGDIGKMLWVLMGTIGVVLLIACANVANLLLVRVEGRRQELAIRAALGAGWGQIARELLLESLTLAVAGGLFGLAFAYGAIRLLVAIAPAQLPRLDEIAIDAPVLLFTLAVSLVAGLLFGLVPIVKYAGPHIAAALGSSSRSVSHSRERHRARGALVIVQVALALVLLISSGLMIRTFQALHHVQPGFTRPQEIQTMRIGIPTAQVKDAVPVARTQQAILEKILAIPGVSSAGLSSLVPMQSQGWHDPIFTEDRTYTDSQIPSLRSYKFVSPGLAKTMGNSIVAGRDFTWTDVYDMRMVAMVTENLARELWQDPAKAIGKRIRESHADPWREIVGVVSDERDDGLDKKAPTMALWPILMNDFAGDRPFVFRSVAFMIRSSRSGSDSFIKELQQAVWSVNPNLPLAQVLTQQEIYDKSLARTSFTLVMLAVAGGMALLIGVIGIYGVMSYSVSQRTREIGIRMALGAQRESLTRLFVRHGLALAGIGILCGLAVSAALMRVMSSLLFEVSPGDPATYIAVSLGLVAAAAAASYIPALRAATVDPVEALRAD
ncbi:MAG: ABC transporter permease [Acidobacteriota bacterium]|nr:ABC transporter permease [Acidobacteriota bacterium]